MEESYLTLSSGFYIGRDTWTHAHTKACPHTQKYEAIRISFSPSLQAYVASCFSASGPLSPANEGEL